MKVVVISRAYYVETDSKAEAMEAVLSGSPVALILECSPVSLDLLDSLGQRKEHLTKDGWKVVEQHP